MSPVCRCAPLRAALYLSAVLCTLLPRFAGAFEVNTGVTCGCHEEIAASALTAFLATGRMDLSQVPVPEDGLWKPVADAMFKRLNLQFSSAPERFMAFSLILGARWPDVQGRSITSTEAMYANHGGIDDQASHFLRAPHHDGIAGDAQAVDEAVAFIEERIDRARLGRRDVIAVDEYVEYYGPVSLKVWAAAFYIGTAFHALQDSFSHTVRSDDLRRIYHVMNFVDAITDSYDETRDGLAHSFAMDRCDIDGDNAPIVAAATEATTALLDFFGDETWTAATLIDTWLIIETGCTFENNFCDSPWLPIARRDPTGPILKTFAGCSAVPHLSGRPPTAAAAGLLLLWIAWLCRRRCT